MTRREVDRADREWFHFLGLVTTSLAASLAVVLFATLGLTLAGDLISPVFVERRSAILAGGVALVWVPVAFVTMRRRLAEGVARGELPPSFDTTRGSAALCMCAMLSAAVGIWTQDGALAGVQGSGSMFLWVVTHAVLTWFALRALRAFPALSAEKPPTATTASQRRRGRKRRR